MPRSRESQLEILILGHSGSGKKTFANAISSLFGWSPSHSEERELRGILQNNILDCLEALIRFGEKENLSLKKSNRQYVDTLRGISRKTEPVRPVKFPAEQATALQRLACRPRARCRNTPSIGTPGVLTIGLRTLVGFLSTLSASTGTTCSVSTLRFLSIAALTQPCKRMVYIPSNEPRGPTGDCGKSECRKSR